MRSHHWASRQPDPFERGRAFGHGLSLAVENSVSVYLRMLREDVGLDRGQVAGLGTEAATAIRAFRPSLAAEIEGIAAGSGQPPELIFAINARTELLSGGLLAGAGGECSTVGLVDGSRRRALLAQTWDFHPELARSRVVWSIRGAGGSAITTFTEAGIVGKLGVNSAGVAVGIDYLATERDARSGGVPVHVLARAVLEGAGSLEEACDLITRTRTAASACLTVAGPAADGSVGIVAFERWPGGAERRPAAGTPPRLVHTNHFLGPIGCRDLVAGGHGGAGSYSRYDQLIEALGAAPDCRPDSVHGYLSSVVAPDGGEAVFRSPDPGEPWVIRCATLATVAFEVPSGCFWLRDECDPDAPLAPVGAPRPEAER